MPDHPAISVVVPLYNEEGNVAELQRQIESALEGRDYEIVFVDDGSSDDTLKNIPGGERVRVPL